jgi:hypothetical protein
VPAYFSLYRRYMKDIEQFYNTQIEEMPANVADLL